MIAFYDEPTRALPPDILDDLSDPGQEAATLRRALRHAEQVISELRSRLAVLEFGGLK